MGREDNNLDHRKSIGDSQKKGCGCSKKIMKVIISEQYFNMQTIPSGKREDNE